MCHSTVWAAVKRHHTTTRQHSLPSCHVHVCLCRFYAAFLVSLSLSHLYRVQLWGAALPLNSPKVPCILDPAARVGVCGDWLTGASIQSAWLSGQALANRLAALRGRGLAEAAELAIGLQEPFVPLAEATAGAAAEIGEFPGCKVPAASQPSQQRRQPQQQQQQQRAQGEQQQRRPGPHRQQQQQPRQAGRQQSSISGPRLGQPHREQVPAR